MERGAPANDLPDAGVDSAAPKLENTMAHHRKQNRISPYGTVQNAMVREDKQDRALLALQVSAISGFFKSVGSTQMSCLSLCNTCRQHIPVQWLRVNTFAPQSILSIVYPSVQRADTEGLSRLWPIGKVLKVHWAVDVHHESSGYVEENDEPEESHVIDFVDMGKVQWPPGTREIALSVFNRCIDAVTWPSGLKVLCLGEPAGTASLAACKVLDSFNMPLDGVTLPVGLREIFLGKWFNKPIDGVAWPEGLERLSLPGFNQPIRDVQWPPGLKSLEFVSPSNIRLWKEGGTTGDFIGDWDTYGDFRYGHDVGTERGHGCFDQPLDTSLPPSLERLWLSRAFDRPMENIAWPSGLVTLGLVFDFRGGPSCRISWPSGLEELFLFNKPTCWDLMIPQGSKVTVLDVPYVIDDGRYAEEDAEEEQCKYCSDVECGRSGSHCWIWE